MGSFYLFILIYCFLTPKKKTYLPLQSSVLCHMKIGKMKADAVHKSGVLRFKATVSIQHKRTVEV